MKITESKIRKIIRNIILEDAKSAAGIGQMIAKAGKKKMEKHKSLLDKLKDFSVESDIGRDKDLEASAKLQVQALLDRMNEKDRKIAEENFEKLRKNRQLFKGMLKISKTASGEKYVGTSVKSGEGSLDAKLLSYLLVGHPDFKGVSREGIQKYLAREMATRAVTEQEGGVGRDTSEYVKKIGGIVKNSENREIISDIVSSRNLISGGQTFGAKMAYTHKIGESQLKIEVDSYKFKNIPEYKYGGIETKGKGLSSLMSILKCEIDGKESLEIMHLKGRENLVGTEKAKKAAAQKNGLWINGEQAYTYGSKYQSPSSNQGAFESAIQRFSRAMRGTKNLKSKLSPENIVSGVLKNYLKELEFNPSDFKIKTKSPRQEVLIGSDGKSVIGSEAIDKYFAKNLPKIKYSKKS